MSSPIRLKRILIFSATGLLILFCLNYFLLAVIRKSLLPRELSFVDHAPSEVIEDLKSYSKEKPDETFAKLDPVVAFSEVNLLDDDSRSYSNWCSQYGGAGVLVFDANNDGLPDLYLTQDSQNWTRPTDENGVLADEPRYQKNVLYLNQGNDDKGHPRFVQVGKIKSANDSLVKEELLIEDYLFPREKVSDSEKRYGRKSNVAVAADFNNDGWVDIYIGNEPAGMKYSHPETHYRTGQFVDPVGRQARETRVPFDAMGIHLVNYKAEVSLDNTRLSARGDESEGANSLYLNLGDQDGDGIPEWKDASRESGLEGVQPTISLAVADVDLDGDLDIYSANAMDLDFLPNGCKFWAGGPNELYINQLSETGQFAFKENAEAMDVDGVFDEDYPMPDFEKLRKIPFLPAEYSMLFFSIEKYKPDFLEIDGREAGRGEISWGCIFQDVNDDGFPDLWVANDFGLLRLFINKEGKGFELGDHPRKDIKGSWMSFVSEDFNGDLHEDLFAGNLGGGAMNSSVVMPDWHDFFDPWISVSISLGYYFTGNANPTHIMIDGSDHRKALFNRIRHSKILPPDTSLPNNIRKPPSSPLYKKKPVPFDPKALDVYEFAWGATAIDVQNDGRPDCYFTGGLLGRGGGLLPVTGTNPGRLLVNATHDSDSPRFMDLTAEHHVFNIEGLKYDRLESDGYVYRRAPAQNWSKRDMVYSYDRGTWTSQGARIQEKVINSDMIQLSENGRSVIAADLNNDGFEELIVRNHGGYDSRSPNAVNLKAMIKGKPRVIPAHSYHYPSPTNFEPGRTRIFLNQYTTNHWLKVRLIDDSEKSLNRDAIGAKVIVNGKLLKVKRSGSGSYLGNRMTDLHFGLGKDVATKIKIHWPDRERSVSEIDLPSVTNQLVTISKVNGLITAQTSQEN